MKRLAASADRFHAKQQRKQGGPTFGRAKRDVERERKVMIEGGEQARKETKAALFGIDAGFTFKAQPVPAPPDWAKEVDRMFAQSVARMHARAAEMFAKQVRVYFGGPITPGLANDTPIIPGLKNDPERGYYKFGCELPPTDCPIELAYRRAKERCGGRRQFESEYRSQRLQASADQILRALHQVLGESYKTMGKGVSRATYALSKHSVLKVPCYAEAADFEANLKEARLWRKHKRRGVIKLAACRLVKILGIPCLIMQRLYLPGKGEELHKGDTPRSEAPVWYERLDGVQCALTRGGEWVAYDYGFQYESDITRPLSPYENKLLAQRSSRQAAE